MSTRPTPNSIAGEAPPGPECDHREIGRIVATVLLASGAPSAAELSRANDGLARLGRPGIERRDLVVSTPEELAPLVPPLLRDSVAALLKELTAGDPIRGRVAEAFLRLWGGAAPLPLSRDAPSGFTRWLVGTLPRHQDVVVPEEKSMIDHAYRSIEPPIAAPPVIDPIRARVERICREHALVVAAIERVIVGKRDVVERALSAIAARGHVLFVDVPGVGKTQLCKAIAAALGLDFGRVQLTPDLLPMDLTGASVYEAHEKRFVFRPGPLFHSLILADELNRATPKTQSALLEVMEERTVTVDGTTYRMSDPFQVLATMNPLDHEGTFALPAAQIDRFMMMLELGYPTQEDEVRVLDTHLAPDPALTAVKAVVPRESILHWQATVPFIHAAPLVKRAAVDYVHALRKTTNLPLSPRATLAWMRAAQARAMFSGREFVTIEDLLFVSADVLRHRLWMSGAEIRDRLRALQVGAGAGGSGDFPTRTPGATA